MLCSWGRSLALLGSLTYFTGTGNYSHHGAALNSQPGTAEEFSGVQQSPDVLEGGQLFPAVQRWWPWQRQCGHTPPKLVSWINNPSKLSVAKANDKPPSSFFNLCHDNVLANSLNPSSYCEGQGPTFTVSNMCDYVSVCLQKCKGLFH